MWVSAKYADRPAELFGFDFTYSYNANPIACAVGIAVLDEIEKRGLCENPVTRGADLRAGLERLKERYPIVGDVRGKGLLLAVELLADQDSKAPLPLDFMATSRIRAHGLNNGIMLYARPSAGARFGQWFIVAPPLTITPDEIYNILERTEATVSAVCEEAQKSELL